MSQRVLYILLFFSVATLAGERQPDAILDAYNSKLKKLTTAFKKKAGKIKKETVLKLMSLRKQMERKNDSDGAAAIGDLVKRIKNNAIIVTQGNLADVISDDIGGVPPPPGEETPPPLTQEQLDAGKTKKTKRITKAKALHKALAALNPAYDKKAVCINVSDGVITAINLNHAGIVNISPLAGLKYVNSINLNSNPVWNLKPLSKLHLSTLSLNHTDVRDLKPLKNMRLNWLGISATKVSDISVLKRMPLRGLIMNHCVFIKDFTPLKRLKNLEDLLLPFQATKNKEIKFLKKLKKLKYIDTDWKERKQSAEDFWENTGI